MKKRFIRVFTKPLDTEHHIDITFIKDWRVWGDSLNISLKDGYEFSVHEDAEVLDILNNLVLNED